MTDELRSRMEGVDREAALALLQFDPAWAISGSELAAGMVPSIPPVIDGRSALLTGLATFGIIGVGAAELMFYP